MGKLANILKENREYIESKEKMESQLKEKKTYIEGINKKINLDELIELGYEKAKEIYDEIKLNIDREYRKEIEDLIKQLKEDKYKILKIAHYYPEINNIEILSDEKKRKLDEVLYYFKNNYLMTHSNSWYSIKLTEEERKIALEYLYNAGTLSKNYELHCECGEEMLVITEEVFLKHKKYFDIKRKCKDGNITEEEKIWAQDFVYDGEIISTIDCWHCDGIEVESFSDIDQGRIIYRVVKQPDMTYASK